MPKAYEEIKDKLLEHMVSEEDAKRSAAKIFISQGKSKADRSARAKSLHD